MSDTSSLHSVDGAHYEIDSPNAIADSENNGRFFPNTTISGTSSVQNTPFSTVRASDSVYPSKSSSSINTPNFPVDEDIHHKMSLSSHNLIPNSSSGGIWSGLTSLEKALSVALGLVSTLSVALMIAVIVVGVELNKDDYSPITKSPTSTELPPWLTTIPVSSTTSARPGTVRPRPTTTNTPCVMKDEKLCITPECVKTAADILTNIDTNVEPCNDFYRFACGGWLESNTIPGSKTQWGQFDAVTQKINHEIRRILETKTMDDPIPLEIAKTFYNTCISQGDKNELPLLLRVIEEMLPETKNGTTLSNVTASINLGRALGKIRRTLGGNYIFRISMDEKFSENNTIYMEQPVLGLPIRQLLNQSNSELIEAYTELIRSLWTVAYPDDDADSAAETIVAFEKSIARISTNEENKRDVPEMFYSFTIVEFYNFTSKNISNVNWKGYYEEVLKDVLKSNTTLSLDNKLKVVVKDAKYYQRIASVLDETDSEIITNYLRWRILYEYGDTASEPLREHYLRFKKKTRGIQHLPMRWETCVEQTNSYLGMAISYRYVQTNLEHSNYTSLPEKVGHIVEGIRNTFLETLEEVDWIGENETLEVAREKAEKLSFTHFPEWLTEKNNTVLLEYYRALTLKKSSSHLQNYFDIVEWTFKKLVKGEATIDDMNKWTSTTIPTTVNVAYSALHNSISFPLGIMQHPFYADYADAIAAMNYGSIGAIIGHEFIYALDDKGRQRDADGNIRDWWGPKTIQNRKVLDKCFQEQYKGYNVKELGNVTMNSTSTLGENIADNGGMRAAYSAYQRHLAQNGEDQTLPGVTYSPEKLFFLAYAQTWCTSYTPEALKALIVADVHSPALIRVRGVIENSEEFAYAWSCPRSERKVCRVW